MAIDPICKMQVDEANARWTTEHKGKTYYFCARGCKETFDENPEFYLFRADNHSGHGCQCCGPGGG